jgi:hypothetical protein
MDARRPGAGVAVQVANRRAPRVAECPHERRNSARVSSCRSSQWRNFSVVVASSTGSWFRSIPAKPRNAWPTYSASSGASSASRTTAARSRSVQSGRWPAALTFRIKLLQPRPNRVHGTTAHLGQKLRARQFDPVRADRYRENLASLRSRPQDLPRQPFGSLLPCFPSSFSILPWARGDDHPDQPDPSRQMARGDRRYDLRRRHSRPPRPQRPLPRSRRRQPAPNPTASSCKGLTPARLAPKNYCQQDAAQDWRLHVGTTSDMISE